MSDSWHSLLSQKLALARALLIRSSQATSQVDADASGALAGEACRQGAIELILRARRLLLTMIARLYQQRHAEPVSLDEIRTLTGDGNPDVEQLVELARTPGSWWHHLDQLEHGQSHPPAARKTVSADNIIAVARETGPDRSEAALLETLKALKAFADELSERHGEW
ncbi:DUF6586 family protein [Marinobacter sp. C2H3]|uniref:DUF6586 family protein n=1 Tax=Marinobacter sp. C2H3 TaxID=3119003 RepID=UPI00300F7041